MVREMPERPLISNCPFSGSADLGANTTLNLVVLPALSTSGKLSPLTANFELSSCNDNNLIAEEPVLESVADNVFFSPTNTFPKGRCPGEQATCTVAPAATGRSAASINAAECNLADRRASASVRNVVMRRAWTPWAGGAMSPLWRLGASEMKGSVVHLGKIGRRRDFVKLHHKWCNSAAKKGRRRLEPASSLTRVKTFQITTPKLRHPDYDPGLRNDGLSGTGRSTLYVARIDCGGLVVIRLIRRHGAVGICRVAVQRRVDL